MSHFDDDVPYDWSDPYNWSDPHDYRRSDDEHLRLRHLVLVDGRLVDSWTAPVEGTRWEQHARRHDQERVCRQAHVAPVPPKPMHEQVLDWLDVAVGGRVALEALDEVVGPIPAPAGRSGDERAAHQAVSELLDRVAARFFHEELGVALQHGLTLLHEADAALVLRPRSAAHLAAALAWVVGRANGAVGAGTGINQKDLQRELGLSTSISAEATRVRRALQGLRQEPALRPSPCPDLLPLGHPDLLTPMTRHGLIRLRDLALAARTAQPGDDTTRAASPSVVTA